MKKTKRISAILLCVLMLCATVLSACADNDGPTSSGDATYKVSVVDGVGASYTEKVIVKFMKDGTQAAMAAINKQGVAEKVLPRDDYTVEIVSTGSDAECYYDASAAVLTADKTELEIVMAYKVGKAYQTVYDPVRTVVDENGYEVNASVDAPFVNVGSTYVALEKGIRNYFLFSPTESGIYEFSVTGNAASIGYYGMPHFIQSVNAAEMENGKFTVSVSNNMIGTGDTGTTVMVIGVDTSDENIANCIVNIIRTDDAEKTIEDEAWTVYKATATLAPYTLGNATVKEFDLTAATQSYNLVLNEVDGFYHLNSADGPLVLVRLGEPSKYLESFKKILETTGVKKYFFDEDGNFIKKESYTECLNEYIGYMDPDAGVYPLTEDLKYIIQQHGYDSGWCDIDSGLYLFKDQNGDIIPGINHEIAWLFMCCYVV